MQAVIQCLKTTAGMNDHSEFVDIGAGIGR
jgi:hypothetical protein